MSANNKTKKGSITKIDKELTELNINKIQGFPSGSVVKSLPAKAGDTGMISDPLEKGKATHSSILAWRSPWTV